VHALTTAAAMVQTASCLVTIFIIVCS